MRYSKYSGRGNFFSLPNEVFLLGLSAGELSVYSFLKRCENRKTHQCWPSIRTIGEAVRMSENTARKYIRQLEERGLITTEPTEVITKTGEKRNGNLLFTLRPIQDAYAAPTVQPDRRRWCIVTAGMVHGDRRCGAPGRHAENYSGMPLRLRMDSPSIWMV